MQGRSVAEHVKPLHKKKNCLNLRSFYFFFNDNLKGKPNIIFLFFSSPLAKIEPLCKFG